MRIFIITLILTSLTSGLTMLTASATELCGVFRAVGYVPPGTGGTLLIASPKAVTPTKIKLLKGSLGDEFTEKIVEVHVSIKSACYFECAANLVKVVRTLSPFDSFQPFNRDETAIIKSEPCTKTPQQVTEEL